MVAPKLLGPVTKAGFVEGGQVALDAVRQLGSLQEGLPADDSAAVRRGDSRKSSRGGVHFKQTVSCVVCPNITGADEKTKAEMWWQPADFAEFLKIRVEIGKGYRLVAKRRGVAVGSEFPPEPSLSHESRRGLGLGRNRIREKNRKKYIAAVMNEQARQRREVFGDDEQQPETRPFDIDTERLARAARRSSEEDRKYAIEQAAKDYKRTLEDHKKEELEIAKRKALGLDEVVSPRSPKRMRSPSPSPPAAMAAMVVVEAQGPEPEEELPEQVEEALARAESPAAVAIGSERQRDVASVEASEEESPQPQLVRVNSFLLNDLGHGPEEVEESFERSVSPISSSSAYASKGYGLSRESLAQAGLSATGHLMQGGRRSRGARNDSDGEDEFANSDMSGGEMSGGESDCSFTSVGTDPSVGISDEELP